jgi:hypothetical protein
LWKANCFNGLAASLQTYGSLADSCFFSVGSSTHEIHNETALVIKPDDDLPDVPPKPPEPYFIVPPGFRPNAVFVGMDEKLKILDQRLCDRRRNTGTACVLLHGQAGAGKSHLAREYIFKHKKKFPGGIFWVNATSRLDLERDFWTIAQKVVAKDDPQLRLDDETGLDFVSIVKEWFEGREKWLIVMDSVMVDKETDFDELQQFIPDSKKSSLIYVSRSRRLEVSSRLLNPVAIKIPPLKLDDGRKLLFKEIPIRKPNDGEIKRANELTEQVGGLPLAICAIAKSIANTRQPLVKYSIRSYAGDPKVGATYHRIMNDLRMGDHEAAVSLMNILCWFASDIPVELIHLGFRALKPLRIEVRSSEDSSPIDLNNTLGVLMRHALIERNEPEDESQSSSTQGSFTEPEPIDVLHVHSVVQKYCRDSLNDNDELPYWLHVAVKLFIHSFQEADLRIKQRPEAGRVSDYREYLVHGQRLQDHVHNYKSRKETLENIRMELAPTLMRINSEILDRAPESSQESVHRTVLQVSIFDRTSSSSSSGLSEPEEPHRGSRPAPLQLLGENMYGIPHDYPSLESPQSMDTASPSFVANGAYHDNQTADLHKDDLLALPMERGLSDTSTAKPPDLDEMEQKENENWQVVLPAKKPEKKPQRPRRNLRQVSTKPSSARTEVIKDNATGSGSRATPPPQTINGLTSSSDAVTSLTKVHHKSPPPSRGGGSVRSGSRGHSLSSTPPQRPSYAAALSGWNSSRRLTSDEKHRPNLNHSPGSGYDEQRGRQRNNLLREPDIPGQSHNSPLRSEVLRGDTSDTSNSTTTETVESLLSPIEQALDELSAPLYHTPSEKIPFRQPFPVGPNPDSLIVENVSVMPRQPKSRSRSPLAEITNVHDPPGPPRSINYSSGHSSKRSSPEIFNTEFPIMPTGQAPVNIPARSFNMPNFRATHTPPTSDMFSNARSSPRTAILDRFPGQQSPDSLVAGALSRENSRPGSSHNVQHHLSNSDSNILSEAGSWARSRASPPEDTYRRAGSAAMSRESSGGTGSGPGLAIRGLHGLELQEFLPSDQVTFGAFSPLDLSEARRRTIEKQNHIAALQERRSQILSVRDKGIHLSHHSRWGAEDTEAARRASDIAGNLAGSVTSNSSAPYPIVDLMPSDEEIIKRGRGYSLPGSRL